MKKKIALLLAACLCLSGCQIGRTTTKDGVEIPKAENDVKVTVLDIGKADCIVIQTKEHTVMIDTGEHKNADKIEAFLQEQNINKIDYLELTHYDKDHIGGLSALLKDGIEIGDIYAINKPVDTKTYRKMTDALATYNKELTYIEEQKNLKVDDILLQMYPPLKDNYIENADELLDEGETEGENEFSLVTKMTHGRNTFLFTGDACNGRLEELAEQIDLDVDYLKVPHHGGKDDNSKQFFKDCKAEYAVITCSEKHPASDKVIEDLEKDDTQIYETEDGNVACVSNGNTLNMSIE